MCLKRSQKRELSGTSPIRPSYMYTLSNCPVVQLTALRSGVALAGRESSLGQEAMLVVDKARITEMMIHGSRVVALWYVLCIGAERLGLTGLEE